MTFFGYCTVSLVDIGRCYTVAYYVRRQGDDTLFHPMTFHAHDNACSTTVTGELSSSIRTYQWIKFVSL
jgi:hypothetical protein